MQTRRSRWRQRGGTQILFLICCPVLLGAAALTVDVGSIYITRQKLQNRVDAAALAAGPELPNQKAAQTECTSCAVANGLDATTDHLTITIMNAQGQAVASDDNQTARELSVSAEENVPMTFARVFGIDKWPVGAQAVVAMDEQPVNVVTKNSTPFGIDKNLYSAQNQLSVAVFPCVTAGQKQQLWITPGNLWPSDVQKLLSQGNAVTLSVGDHLTANPDTHTYSQAIGQALLQLAQKSDQMADPNADPNNPSPNDPRMLTVPLLQKLDGGADGTDTHNVEVVGFASFYVMGWDGQNITGRFIDTGSADGQVSPSKPPSQGTQKGKITAVRLIG